MITFFAFPMIIISSVPKISVSYDGFIGNRLTFVLFLSVKKNFPRYYFILNYVIFQPFLRSHKTKIMTSRKDCAIECATEFFKAIFDKIKAAQVNQ